MNRNYSIVRSASRDVSWVLGVGAGTSIGGLCISYMWGEHG